MDLYVSRKRQRISSPPSIVKPTFSPTNLLTFPDEDSTELKLALLASLHPHIEQHLLLDILLASDGSVDAASCRLSQSIPPTSAKKSCSNHYQSSLSTFAVPTITSPNKRHKPLTKKGRTLHLYSPEDVAAHTPCSIIHNFLPAPSADALLEELLTEATTFERQTFKLFDNVVQSPHSACFYVENQSESEKQKTEYLYNGSYLTDVRSLTPNLRKISHPVEEAVNSEIETRVRTHYPSSRKLPHQSPHPWIPNAAFVNCYANGGESVGYHSDQLTYLGPRAVIGSLSLGVAREFRVRRVMAQEDAADGSGSETTNKADNRADQSGQIAIHLPHNSLLVMHAEMQEEWKHSIHPAPTVNPHPIAGNRRINVTYRYYRQDFHPRYTPRCKCGIATVLRCVQRKKENRGRYFWLCHAGAVPGKEGCTFFQWAEFDDDGNPPWAQARSKQSEPVSEAKSCSQRTNSPCIAEYETV